MGAAILNASSRRRQRGGEAAFNKRAIIAEDRVQLATSVTKQKREEATGDKRAAGGPCCWTTRMGP